MFERVSEISGVPATHTVPYTISRSAICNLTDPRSIAQMIIYIYHNRPGISTGRIALILSSTCTCPAVIIKAHAQEPIILYNPIDNVCQVVYKNN